MNRSHRISGLALIAASLLALPGGAEETAPDTPYRVECGTDEETGGKSCKVDKGTYIGWRTYHAVCIHCHGQDAAGSSFAPSFLNKELTWERYIDVLENGITGQNSVMPAFKDNPNVNKRYKEIYSYLKARADGALPPGRPGRFDR